MSEEFWIKALDILKYTLGGIGILIFFRGWPFIGFNRDCKCDKCKNFKKES